MEEFERGLWSAMHCGSWREVSQTLRDWYSLSCLILGRKSVDLQWADRGLIFGGPLSKCHAELRRMIDTFPKPLSTLSDDFFKSSLMPSPSITNQIPESAPTLDSFVLNHLNPGHPVVMRGLVEHWAAVDQWRNKSFWLNNFKNRWIPVEKGIYSTGDFSQELVSISSFIESREDLFLAQYDIFREFPELDDSISPLPDFCFLNEIGQVTKNLFFGPAGKFSPLHTDPTDNLMCVVFGKKYVKLFQPCETPFLYPSKETTLLNSSTLPPDLTQPVSDSEFPEYKKALSFDTVLEAGDALFIPKGWWHFVKSLDISANVALFFE